MRTEEAILAANTEVGSKRVSPTSELEMSFEHDVSDIEEVEEQSLKR